MQLIMRMAMLTVLILVAAVPAVAQSPGTSEVDRVYKALDPRTRDVVETYLRTDCEIGEVGAALKAVLQLAEAVRPYLIAVRREGPPSPVLTDFERGLDAAWEARQEFLKTPDARELGQEMFEMMRAITKDRYRKDQLEAIQAKYRERAGLALRAMGDPETDPAAQKVR